MLWTSTQMRHKELVALVCTEMTFHPVWKRRSCGSKASVSHAARMCACEITWPLKELYLCKRTEVIIAQHCFLFYSSSLELYCCPHGIRVVHWLQLPGHSLLPLTLSWKKRFISQGYSRDQSFQKGHYYVPFFLVKKEWWILRKHKQFWKETLFSIFMYVYVSVIIYHLYVIRP